MSGVDGPSAGFSRRRLLETGGVAAALGVVLAACGESGGEGTEQPGRVGYAPPATPLPTAEINDAVYLRTATSIELLIVDVYATITESGALDGEDQALIDRLSSDHTAAAEATVALTSDAGGEPYECANTWYTERIVPEMIVAIEGDPDAGVPASDDPAGDMMRVAYGFETMASSMYQKMTEQVAERGLRTEMAGLGAAAARHSAAVAIALTGAPDGYISPVVLGVEETPDESGRAELFAIPATFGSLTSTEIVVGAPNDAGTRPNFALETPAENAYVYEGETCDA